MMGIFAKELRDQAKTALAATLMATAGMALALSHTGREGAWKGLSGEGFQMITVLASAIGGLGFGILQTLPEMRNGSWALLVHRPISRTRIFFGKMLAGIALYLLALGLPLAAAVVWVSLPGSLGSPYAPALMLPAVVDILAGIGYYFAGMLVGVRSVRWHGSRLLPVGGAAAIHAAALPVPQFWQATAVVAAGAALLGVAAWGSFIRAGVLRSTPIAARVALGAGVLLGIGFFGTVTLVIGSTYLRGFEFVDDGGRPGKEFHELTEDGDIVLVRQVHTRREVTDLSGRARPDLGTESKPYAAEPLHPLFPLSQLYPRREHPEWGGRLGYRNPETYIRYIFELQEESTRWYEIKSQGLLVGYDKRTKREIARLGPFSPDVRFQFVNTSNDTFGFALERSKLWRLDFSHGKVTLALELPGEEIVDAQPVWAQNWTREVAVWTTNHVVILEGGEQRFSVPLDVTPVQKIEIGPLLGGVRTVKYESPSNQAVFVQYRPDGTVRTRHEFALQDPPWSPTPHHAWYGAFFPLPVGFLLPADTSLGFSREWIRHFLLFGLCASVASAMANGFIAKRHAMDRGRTVLWGALGLVFGPSGIMLALALLDWPARARCGGCGRLRILEHAACEHCKAPASRSSHDGTEIFELDMGMTPAATYRSH
ncbi:hypothetical protein LVJ94_32710 [Pendulispora rubella]|uniref:Uncharacterized protein n=1 Tax=Pendulispora rubella TaxID=2741070 RepID=A0ABZ2KT19_9BACT